MTLARELIEAMGNGVESEAVHRLNRNRFLRALRTLRDRGPGEAMTARAMQKLAEDADCELGDLTRPEADATRRRIGIAFNAMLAELIREIEEERP